MKECPSFNICCHNCSDVWAINDFIVIHRFNYCESEGSEISCTRDWGKMVLFLFCTFSNFDLEVLFQRAVLLLWSFCAIHIFLDICVGARMWDSELLKHFCVMLASSYVLGTPDSATCSISLPREAVVKGLLPRDEITALFINEFCIL